MDTKLIIENLRGSVFINAIPFHLEIVEVLKKVIPGYSPILVGTALPPLLGTPVTPTQQDWAMVSGNGREKLIFYQQSNKIDFIYDMNTEYQEDVFNPFAHSCQEVFGAIMEYCQREVTRLAISPTLSFPNPESYQEVITQKIATGTFNETSASTTELSQVFRPGVEINGQQVIMNFLSKFYIESTLIPNAAPTIVEKPSLRLDINTYPIKDLKFCQQAMLDFFKQSDSYIKEFLTFYVS